MILNQNYGTAARFLRGTLRTLISDLAAVPFSWYGNRGNISVAKFTFIKTLIGASDSPKNLYLL